MAMTGLAQSKDGFVLSVAALIRVAYWVPAQATSVPDIAHAPTKYRLRAVPGMRFLVCGLAGQECEGRYRVRNRVPATRCMVQSVRRRWSKPRGFDWGEKDLSERLGAGGRHCKEACAPYCVSTGQRVAGA
eukprot:3324276-Rhodomonas_salina.2